MHRSSLEQIALVDGGCPGHGVRSTLRRQVLEGRHVDINRSGIERDVPTMLAEALRSRERERLAEIEESLSEVGPGLPLTHVSPEEGGQLIARMGAAARERQVRQEPLRFPGRHLDGGRTGFQADLKATQEREVDARHHAFTPPRATSRTQHGFFFRISALPIF